MPSEYVSTSSRSLRCSWTTLRSVALIASSATGRRPRIASAAAWSAWRCSDLLAAGAVAGGVDHDADAAAAALAVGDLEGEVLDRVDRLAVAADEEPEVVALEDAADPLVVLLDA